MSEEFSNGVKIILSRVESNPDEFKGEYSPWRSFMNMVMNKKAGTAVDMTLLRALTDAEIDALHEVFLPLARQEFDEWVMKLVFNEVPSFPQEYQPSLFAQAGKSIHGAYNIGIQNGGTGAQGVKPQTITLASNTVVQGTLDADPSPAFLAKIKKGLGL